MLEVLAVDWHTGTRLGTVRYQTLEWRDILCDPGEWTVTVEAHNPALNYLLPGRTIVYVHDTERRVIHYAGIVWRTRRNPESATVDVSGSGLLSYLDRRLVRDTLNMTADQFDIAAQLISEMQAVTGGGVPRLTVKRRPNLSGVTRTIAALSSDLPTVGDTVAKLAEVDNGFEYTLTAAWQAGGAIGHTLTLAYPRLGSDLPYVWADGTDVVLDQHEDDYSEYATWWRARGAGDGASAPTVDLGPATQAVTLRGVPVLDAGQTYTELKTAAALTAQGTADLRASRIETLAVVLSATTRYPLGTWHVGDSVRIVSPPPSITGLDGSTYWRVGAYGASIDLDGQLVVTLDVDKARNNARPILRPLDRLDAYRTATARRLALVENAKS